MDLDRLFENLRPCPKCGGKINLYGTTDPDRTKHGYNCFAKCLGCKSEYPMPKAQLKTYKGCRVYPQSIKKAVRIWNEESGHV